MLGPTYHIDEAVPTRAVVAIVMVVVATGPSDQDLNHQVFLPSLSQEAEPVESTELAVCPRLTARSPGRQPPPKRRIHGPEPGKRQGNVETNGDAR